MMNKQKDYFGLTLVISVLLILILILFACAPTKVKIYSKATQPEKTIPPKPSSERTAQEKTAPVKTTPEKTTSVKTDIVKPPSERSPTEKIPTVKPAPEKTYTEAISQWKSHQDLVKWMERDFSFDVERYKRFEGTLPIPRTPEETFQLKSGIYIDAAMFLKENLNRINPSYKAQIVILIIRPYGFNHYVCSFRMDGKLFIMDYGTPYKEVTGVHGPYNSLDEYKRFYEKHHPEKRHVEGIGYLQ
jgi:hypothetical protein